MATGPSILETPTYIVAIVLLAFVALATCFEWVVHTIKHFLSSRKRVGMLRAVEYSVNELTLLGFISLVVIALEKQLSSICVDISPSSVSWTILHHMYSKGECSCCLGETAYIQDCIFQYGGCGNPQDPTCNCDGKNPICVSQFLNASSPSTSSSSYSAAAPAYGDAGRRLLAPAAAGSGGAAGTVAVTGYELPTCFDSITVPPGICPAGKIPAVSFLALEQVHLLVFVVSLVHVLCGFLLYGVASGRIWLQWARWEKSDDPESKKVRAALKEYFSNLERQSSLRPQLDDGGGQSGKTVNSEQLAAAMPDKATATGKQPLDNTANDQVVDLEGQTQQQTAIAAATPTRGDGGSQFAQVNGGSSTRAVYPIGSGSMPRILRTFTLSKREGGGTTTTAGTASEDGNTSRSVSARLVESAKCVFLGLSPRVVHFDQYVLLRASFLYTHKLGPGFAFLEHVQRSLEEDLSLVVGLSFEFWAVLIIFYLASGPMGYAAMPAIVLAALVLIPTNAKLVSIIRYVSSHGGAAQLSSNAFPFNRPTLLLIPIKLSLFLCAFIYANFFYFVWQFGANSCCFTDEFYPGWVLPWWTILIVNTVIFIHMGAVTLPAYSLAVQMGSDWKAHMLPKRLTKKLISIANEVKAKVRAEKEANAQAGESEGARAQAAAAVSENSEAALITAAKSSRLERVFSAAARHVLQHNQHH